MMPEDKIYKCYIWHLMLLKRMKCKLIELSQANQSNDSSRM